MNDSSLLLPLATVLAGSLAAALCGLPAIKRRLSILHVSWLLSLSPLAAFAVLLTRLPAIQAGGAALAWQVEWIPSLGLSLGLYFDDLSALFALLVTGIGTLVVVYAGYYFKENPEPSPFMGIGNSSTDANPAPSHRNIASQHLPGSEHWRFLTYLLLFLFSMLGLVMAGDIITLFIFWEGTSITSFLLVAYKTKDGEARRGAFKALFITGGGGIALLAGLLMVSYVAGATGWATILGSGDALRSSDLYPVLLGLVAFGAFTKSAQVPAHIWLPGAMSAPTPASAFLHSATMVKAGIYLMARLNPALGFTDLWFWLLSIAGGITMLTGAYVGLKQNDLKALLAYSTISQLGVLVMLIGQDTSIAYKALVIGILAHALYKSALFMVAGIIDHETGTRDMRRLGGLWRLMPFTFAVGFVAALSMAGLPPLFGFLAKETLLATATHPDVPAAVNTIFPAAAVVAGALLLAQAGLLIWETFLGKPKDPSIHGHEAPMGMVLAPAIPALLGVLVGTAPEPQPMATFLANAAENAYGSTVKVSLAIWQGINVPLLLSIIAISIGLMLFAFRHQVRALQDRVSERVSFNTVYAWVLAVIDRLAGIATQLQGGKLRTYLSIMLAAMLVLVTGALAIGSQAPLLAGLNLSAPAADFRGEIAILRLFSLLVISVAAVATILLNRDFSSILAMGASGLAVAVLMVLEPAPDVALVQIVVDILSMVILVLALARLPRRQRHRARQLTYRQSRLSLVRDGLIALASGLLVAVLTLVGLASRPRVSQVTPFYEASAKALTGAKDIVGAIVVDFRALDTLIEIAVFSLAGLGVYTLLRYGTRTAGDRVVKAPPPMARLLDTFGIGGHQTSSFLRALAYVSLPLSILIAVVHIIYGHDQPGDGFTAGVIISLAVGFWYVVFGYEETKRRLTWVKSAPLIAGGLLLAILAGLLGYVANASYLSHVDFTWLNQLPLPAGFNLNTSLLFELAICLAVLGSASYMLDTLGHPEQG